nr:CBD-DrsB1 [synthetic construct]
MAHYTTLLLSTLLVGTALAQRGSHHHHHHAMWKDVLKKIGTVALHAGKAALGAVADTISQEAAAKEAAAKEAAAKEAAAKTKCMGPKDCLYPNPDSCTTYIQCVPLDEVGNAKPVVKPCPKGLQWNDNVGKKWCDYPNLSTCPV